MGFERTQSRDIAIPTFFNPLDEKEKGKKEDPRKRKQNLGSKAIFLVKLIEEASYIVFFTIITIELIAHHDK